MNHITAHYSTLSILIVIALFFYSCQEIDHSPESLVNPSPETKVVPPTLDPSGRVSFANLTSFSDFLEKNIDKPIEELSLFEGKFVSLRKSNLDLAASNHTMLRVLEDDAEEDSIIVDEFTASLVNEKRELMIDGKVVRYTAFGTWVYHDDFTARVEQLLPTMTNHQMEDIYATHDFAEDPFYELEPGIFLFGSGEDEDKGYEGVIIDQKNSRLIPWSTDLYDYPGCNKSTNKTIYNHPENKWDDGVRIIETYPVMDRRRMKIKVWSTNYLTHATGGFETKYQRRVTGIWWTEKADEISVSVRANLYYPIPYQIEGDQIKLYMPFKYDPWLYDIGYEPETNNNNALVGFGIITAQIGISNNLNSLVSTGQFCDSKNDFGTNANSFFTGENKLCKPKWKTAKNVKFKNSESCHYIKDGDTTIEVQISTKYDS